ncbi:hypothetical protein [Haloarcula sp. 1CSR25-25]|uniref:hypothetical protein n=1 Tax=Haloarcula sp. 1CSR25-25 TaxID=2862545 RepID=UPI00289E34DE|nr:hypothetical protein [Haloarcula sp. 1CSR25-25]
MVEEVGTSVQEIDEATDTQVDSTQEVVSMVDDVEGTSARTAVAAAAAEQTTELAEAPTLSERAESLEASLDSFKLTTGTTAPDTNGTVVEFWHAMGGGKALLLAEPVREFESQTDGISLALRSKGSYRGTLDATLNAAENGDPPAIAQIFGRRRACARMGIFMLRRGTPPGSPHRLAARPGDGLLPLRRHSTRCRSTPRTR